MQRLWCRSPFPQGARASKPFGRPGKAVTSRLRLQQVVETHRRMLPQSAALQGGDHAGERQSAEGFSHTQKVEPVADIPEGRRAARPALQGP